MVIAYIVIVIMGICCMLLENFNKKYRSNIVLLLGGLFSIGIGLGFLTLHFVLKYVAI